MANACFVFFLFFFFLKASGGAHAEHQHSVTINYFNLINHTFKKYINP